MRARIDLVVLAVLGTGVVVAAALVALRLRGAPSHAAALLMGAWMVPYALAVAWVLWRRPPRRATLVLVFAVAIAARLVMVGHAPTLSSDVYRYVWDGRVQAAGINPYLHPPDSPALTALRDEAIYPFINRKAVPTAYPPTAELAFRFIYAVKPDSVTWTKLAFVLVDMAAVVLLVRLLAFVGMPPQRALLYAWHPLAIFEVAYGGHVEALLVALVLGALAAGVRGRRVARGALTGALLGLATLVKPYALLVAPALAARTRLSSLGAMLVAALAAASLAYLPFLSVGERVLGYIPGYLGEEGFLSGERFHLARRVGELLDVSPLTVVPYYLGSAAAVMVVLGAWAWLAPVTAPAAVARRALVLFTAALVLVTPRYPWYALLAVALLPFARGALLATCALIASITPLLYAHLRTAGNPEWPLDVVFVGGAGAALAGAAWWGCARRRGHAATSSGSTAAASSMP